MGVHTSFVLVHGLSRDELLDRLGMRLGPVVEEPDTRAAGVAAIGPTQDGWTLIVDSPGSLFLSLLERDEAGARRLSAGTRVVTHFLESAVMASTATCYEDGRERWSVTSDADQRSWQEAWPRVEARGPRQLGSPPGPSKLSVRGEPPAGLQDLLDQALREEAGDPGVDVQFGLPSAVVGQVTGWEGLDDPLDEELEFRALLPVEPAPGDAAKPAPGAGQPPAGARRRWWLAFALASLALAGSIVQVRLDLDEWLGYPLLGLALAGFLLLPRSRSRRGRAVASRTVGVVGIAGVGASAVRYLLDGTPGAVAGSLLGAVVLVSLAVLLYPRDRAPAPAGDGRLAPD